ncbi:MAG: hypothetical protein CL916_02470 [Deltaproteobacteria bacterium]|nr:hypothetical protein [Deltaproteobacteria bacterium]
MYTSLNIALVMHGWPPQQYGGVGLYVQALAYALQKQGHNITIIVPNHQRHKKQSFSWGTLQSISFPVAENWKETWFRTKIEIEAHTRSMNFDVLHIHHLGHWPLTFPLYVPTQKTFITLHDYAIICSRGQLYQPQKGICSGPSAPKCTSCIRDQLIYTPRTPQISSFLDRFPKTKSRIKKILRRIPIRKQNKASMQNRLDTAKELLDIADGLISPSHDLIARYQSFTSTPITHQRLPLLSPLEETPLPQMPYRFIFASSVIATKGIHLALDAIRQLPDAELWIAGSTFPVDGWPRFEEEILTLIHATDNAHYLGNIPHDKIFGFLAQSHCLVLPSLWPENSPIIIREALSLGLEVISSFEGGSKEISPLIHTIPNESLCDLVHIMRTIMNAPKRNVAPRFPSMKEHANDMYTLYSSSKF